HAYDGYIVGDERSMFNPNSVMLSIYNRNYNSYWAKSASYTFIEPYIHIDENNVKPKIEKLLNGEEITIEVTSFRNDFRHIESYDDVFTLLVHLGYLSYNPETNGVMIPNTEVAGEFRITLSKTGWGWISKAMANSLTLVEKTISLDSQYVASSFDDCRPDASSFININSEAAMAVAIRFAYYAAIKDYKIFHELPTGKGFADMVFVPVNKPHRPAIVVELKYDKTAKGAIEQIKRKDYPKSLKGFSRRIILVGINYNTKESKHEVEMEVIEGN
ncbi:MAG: PD-(D/E)XK nuclease domain-containing protein, partial [Bacteroidales bacterium]|nr:PD-(D/E)XK nuclease domain-containing protein [Bacteroidales bacterium]